MMQNYPRRPNNEENQLKIVWPLRKDGLCQRICREGEVHLQGPEKSKTPNESG